MRILYVARLDKIRKAGEGSVKRFIPGPVPSATVKQVVHFLISMNCLGVEERRGFDDPALLPNYSYRDERIKQPLPRFRAKIKHIGQTIAERNRQRRPYKFLLPNGIPQSINI